MDTCGQRIEFDITLNFDNVVSVYDFFDRKEDKVGVEKCYQFLDSNAAEFIKKEKVFLRLPFKLLINLIARETFSVSEVYKFALLLEWQLHNTEFNLIDLLRLISWKDVTAADYGFYIRPSSIITDEMYFIWFMESKSNEFSIKDWVQKLLEKYAQQLKTENKFDFSSSQESSTQTDYILYPSSSLLKCDANCQYSLRKFKPQTATIVESRPFTRSAKAKSNFIKENHSIAVSSDYIVQFTSQSPTKPLICGYCDQSFIDDVRLFRHMKELHVNHLIAVNSEETTSNVDNVAQANNGANKAENKFDNEITEIKAVNGNLKLVLKEEEKDESEEEYSTEEVKKTVTTKSNVHVNKKTNKSVKAQKKVIVKESVKPYRFNNAKSLWGCEQAKKNLLVLHRNEMKVFGCKICQREFSNRYRALIHISTVHLKRKNYECGHCHKQFTNRPNLLIHIESRHGDNICRYECDICGEKFMTKCYVYNHKRRVHC